MSSILTNSSAMVALQTLKSVNSNLSKVEDQVSTGKKVATAADDAATWSIAATMSADVSTYGKVSDQLKSGKELVATARTAAEDIVANLTKVQTLIASSAGQTTSAIADIQKNVDSLLATIVSTASSAQYNGISLTKATPDSASVLASVKRDAAGAITPELITVTGVDLEAVGATLTVDTTGSTAAMLTEINTRIATAKGAASTFGAAQTRITSQQDFLSKQTDSLKNGVSALVDADMEEASARLTALQTQQQLAVQSLSIANQAPQSLTKLFQ